MYLIKDSSGKYVKTTVDKLSFTTNATMADTFRSQREAADYIRKRFSKKRRRFYKTVYINDVVEPLSSAKTSIKTNKDISTEINKIDWFGKSQKQINIIVQQQLNPLIEQYRSELMQYDDVILDLRHYIKLSLMKRK